MKYACFLAVRRIRKCAAQYAMVALQIAIGVGVLFAAISLQTSVQTQFDMLRESAENGLIRFTGRRESGQPALAFEDWQELCRRMPETQKNASWEMSFRISGEYQGAEKIIPCLIVSENYYRDVMGMALTNAAKPYAGSQLYPLLSDAAFHFSENVNIPISADDILGFSQKDINKLEGNRFSFNTSNVMKAATLNQIQGQQIEAPARYEDTLIFPQSAAAHMPAWDGVVYLPVDEGNSEQMEIICKQMIEVLTQIHPDAEYVYENDFIKIQNAYAIQKRNTELMRAVSLLLLGVLFFGFTGLLLLLVNKRQFSLTVSRICGANARHIAAELFLEIFFVAGGGAAVGVGISALILRQTENFLFPLVPTWAPCLLCLGMSMAACITVCGFLVFQVLRAPLAEQAKKLSLGGSIC